MEVKALENVSLTFDPLERYGIIGHNGAGKSTLLRLLGGIYPPTSGTRTVEGRISSLFDLTLGFQSEATGWENIAIRGFLQGETPKSIQSKMQEIADFSELGDFLEMPIRHYSPGMLVRLAFSVATSIQPEILLIDEILSAGDMAFQAKALNRMKNLLDQAQLIVIVSHDTGTLANLCTKLIWMDHGRVHLVGETDEVLDAYNSHMKSLPILSSEAPASAA
ncbi:MAG: ABC transporter ATP-binding protein [Planctomycetaceae bacterium]|nr:ABC transporter ATP-binding protein [Planctomycetaceae bacterium]